jgi:hypothetical protein
MGFSRDEFIRVLPLALAAYRMESPRVDNWRISDANGELQVQLKIQPKPTRQLGALNLPVLAVRLEFASGTEQQRQELLRRFERGFQKGGG